MIFFSKLTRYCHQNDELEQKLNAALEENRVLKERNFALALQRTTLLNKIPYGIMICDGDKSIMFSNSAFIELQGYKTESLVEKYPNLRGVKIYDILPENICAYIESSLYGDDENINRSVLLGSKKLHLSTYPVQNVNYAFAIFRNVYKDDMFKDEIYKNVQDVISQNMAMVQKIGFLMGEETSKTTQKLNSVISALKEEGE